MAVTSLATGKLIRLFFDDVHTKFGNRRVARHKLSDERPSPRWLAVGRTRGCGWGWGGGVRLRCGPSMAAAPRT